MPKSATTQEEGKPALREHILNIADELFYRSGIRAIW
jgi:hypothetical protein